MEYIRFEHTGEKLLSILHTVQGWIVAVVLFMLDFIAGHELAVGLVVAVTLMDAIWGITVSIKRKKFALSELARLTVGKLAVYGCAMLAFIGLDDIDGIYHRGGYYLGGTLVGECFDADIVSELSVSETATEGSDGGDCI